MLKLLEMHQSLGSPDVGKISPKQTVRPCNRYGSVTNFSDCLRVWCSHPCQRLREKDKGKSEKRWNAELELKQQNRTYAGPRLHEDQKLRPSRLVRKEEGPHRSKGWWDANCGAPWVNDSILDRSWAVPRVFSLPNHHSSPLRKGS